MGAREGALTVNRVEEVEPAILSQLITPITAELRLELFDFSQVLLERRLQLALAATAALALALGGGGVFVEALLADHFHEIGVVLAVALGRFASGVLVLRLFRRRLSGLGLLRWPLRLRSSLSLLAQPARIARLLLEHPLEALVLLLEFPQLVVRC